MIFPNFARLGKECAKDFLIKNGNRTNMVKDPKPFDLGSFSTSFYRIVFIFACALSLLPESQRKPDSF